MSDAPRVRVERLGREESPVLMVERLLSDPAPLLEDAYAAAYAPPEVEAYPGVRAPCPADYLAVLRRGLLPLLRDVFPLEGWELASAASSFSLVTRRPEALQPRQRIPHTDAREPGLIALMHYLTPGGCSGTSFYRHRATGFETVSAARAGRYEVAVEAELGAAPPEGYIGSDTAAYERIGGVDGAFNRLVAYSGLLLHSGDLPEDFGFSPDPRRGRLTANTFLLFERATR